jgi:hypothetical protein
MLVAMSLPTLNRLSVFMLFWGLDEKKKINRKYKVGYCLLLIYFLYLNMIILLLK